MPHFPVEPRLAVIGLGYVGLPLACAFGAQLDTLGFDIDVARIDALQRGVDSNQETSGDELAEASRLHFSAELADLAARDVYIITVPTPVDEHKRPDFTPLIRASQSVGKAIQPGALVIYESTVYPG